MKNIYSFSIITFFLFCFNQNLLFSQTIFSEDFEGVLDGTTNLPIGWTETGLSDDGIYFVGTDVEANSAGYWPVPPHTMFAMTNDDECNCDKSTDRLILPALDLSTYSGALHLYFSAVNDSMYGGTTSVEVSTDGGFSWMPVTFLSKTFDTYEWVDHDISLTDYLGLANVMISFHYNDEGSWGSGFAVDDILLEALTPAVDLAILSTNNLSEYTVIPFEQLTALNQMNVVVENQGDVDVVDFSVTTNVYLFPDYVNPIQTYSTAASNINVGTNQNIALFTFIPPGVGLYKILHTILATSDNDNTNDTISRFIEISDHNYQRDYNISSNLFLSAGLNSTAIVGNIFDIYNQTQIDSVSFFISPNTAGGNISAIIGTVTAGVPNETGYLGYSSNFEITQSLVDNSNVNNSVYISLPVLDSNGNPIVLTPGTYFVGVKEDSLCNGYELMSSNQIFTANKSFYNFNNGAYNLMELIANVTPMVRAHISPVIDNDGDSYVAGVDCDDNDPSVYQNITVYVDLDGDGYDNGSLLMCIGLMPPTGYSIETLGLDCDDSNVGINPGATDIPDNGIDEDCNGSDATSNPIDNDGDGVDSNSDCDDNDPNVYQNATVYIDNDMDGYDNGTALICMGTNPPFGYISTSLGVDCDDFNGNVNPGATDIPDNGIDENCDGQDATGGGTDNDGDGVDASMDCNDTDPNVYQMVTLFIDTDLDFYDAGAVEMCIGDFPPNGFTDFTLGSDCNDFNAEIYPGANEIPDNGIDEDCDGSDLTTTPVDNDGDSYLSDIDCNDADPNINPGATEIANNGIDEDCDGQDLIISNDPPVIVDDNTTCLTISSVVINILSNDSDSDGNLVPSSIVISTPPSNGTVVVDFVTGLVTYTPNTGFVGNDEFCYFVCDDGNPQECGQACVIVMVQNAEPPVAVDDDTTVFLGDQTSILILLNDSDPNDEITPWNGFTVDLDPNTPGIQLTYTSTNPNGSWTYNEFFQSLLFVSSDNTVGTYVMQYELCDPQELCDMATVTVNVVPNTASLNNISHSTVKVTPNPFIDKVHFSNHALIEDLSVQSFDGKIVFYTTKVSESIDLDNINSGTYFLQLKLKDGTIINQKIIKL
ncbi:MAG: T9SS type A sorting domain-containing protein [Flavobacteriia bacterium]|nr:T9SS type A sorting domain-containing protein [Flavobacteriia bacterium]